MNASSLRRRLVVAFALTGVLAVLATIGGLVVVPGVWEPFLHWIDETAEPLVHATVAEDYGTSAIAVSLGLREPLENEQA